MDSGQHIECCLYKDYLIFCICLSFRYLCSLQYLGSLCLTVYRQNYEWEIKDTGGFAEHLTMINCRYILIEGWKHQCDSKIHIPDYFMNIAILCVSAKSFQPCPTLLQWYGLQPATGFSVHGILQQRILECYHALFRGYGWE